MGPRVHFATSHEGFHSEVRAGVDAYFSERALSRHANWGAVAKIIFWLGTVAGLYYGVVSGLLPGVFVLLLGFAIAEVGFNVGHDALHGAVSPVHWVNTALGWTFDLFGGSSYAWNRAHNVLHHTYTNMPGVDRDIDSEPWMHFQAHPAVARYYRWQYIYAFGYYTLTMLAWTYFKDFMQLSTIDSTFKKRPTARGWLGVFAGKLAHLGLFVVAPLLLYAGPWWHVIVGYILMQMAVGFTLAVVFQLAHVVEGTAFPEAGPAGLIPHSWAEHQLLTTANFSTGGRMATFFTGGLNHQIEHHLFPKISHAHYGALSPIVRRAAAKHGLPYYENKTFFGALASHVRTLKRFGAAAA